MEPRNYREEIKNDVAEEQDISKDEVEDKVDEVKTVTGRVSGCNALNIRANPILESKILAVVQSDTELLVDISGSTDTWLKVCTEVGIEGYCVRGYITIEEE